MSYLEVKLDVPPVQVAGDDTVVSVFYGHVASAHELADSVFSDDSASERERTLAMAVLNLTNSVSEIVRGLEHGRIGVTGYLDETE